MQERKVSEAGKLLDAVMSMMGYATGNRGRKTIKEGHVTVNGKVVSYPNTSIEKGALVKVHDKPVEQKMSGPRSLPFTIHHDDASIFVFDKPAGWIAASADRRKRSAFNLASAWLLGRDPKIQECFFVNKLPKEASGLMVLARSATERARLQREWNKLTKRYYVLAKGEFPEDGVIGKKRKVGKTGATEGYEFNFRRMMQGKTYALLRVEMQQESFSELFSLLEAAGTPVPGYARRGKADDPLGHLGFHFFSVDLVDEKGEKHLIKTPVPRSFLNLVKFNSVKKG